MTISEFNMLEFLVKVAPVAVVMGVVIFFLYKELKSVQAEHKFLGRELRDLEKENLKTLQSLNTLLTTLSASTSQLSDDVLTSVREAAFETNNHVTQRTNMIIDHLNKR